MDRKHAHSSFAELLIYPTCLNDFVIIGGRAALGVKTPRIEQELIGPLRKAFPHALIALDPARTSGRGYYDCLCFKLYVTDSAGAEMEIGDGGDVSWTQKLLSNAKERLCISAVAQERLGTVKA